MAEKKRSIRSLSAVEKLDKRTLAKTGMALSLGTLVATSLLGVNDSTVARRFHIGAGCALLGFSLWHQNLYK